jgi:hypothetical protein
MMHQLRQHEQGCNGCVVYSIDVDGRVIGNVLVPYSDDEYKVYFGEMQRVYPPRQAVECETWGQVIRCIDAVAETLSKGDG